MSNGLKACEDCVERIVNKFILEFCNDHNGEIRFLRSIFYDEKDGAETIIKFIRENFKIEIANLAKRAANLSWKLECADKEIEELRELDNELTKAGEELGLEIAGLKSKLAKKDNEIKILKFELSLDNEDDKSVELVDKVVDLQGELAEKDKEIAELKDKYNCPYEKSKCPHTERYTKMIMKLKFDLAEKTEEFETVMKVIAEKDKEIACLKDVDVGEIEKIIDDIFWQHAMHIRDDKDGDKWLIKKIDWNKVVKAIAKSLKPKKTTDEIIEKTFEKLMAMPKEKLKKEFAEYKSGEIAELLLYAWQELNGRDLQPKQDIVGKGVKKGVWKMDNRFWFLIWGKIRDFIGGIGWHVFLWSVGMTKEKYWDTIYKQEKAYKEGRLYRTEKLPKCEQKESEMADKRG